jgi:hypothetical protein
MKSHPQAALTNGWIRSMTNRVEEPQDGELGLTFEFTDDALEAAANAVPAAYSFVGSPTVSVLVACCSG